MIRHTIKVIYLKVIFPEYPQLSYDLQHSNWEGTFLAEDKADFFQAVFSLVSYGNKTEQQYNTVCVSSTCNF